MNSKSGSPKNYSDDDRPFDHVDPVSALPIRRLRGAAVMFLGCAFLTLSDTASKWETQLFPVGEVIFARSLLGSALLLTVACLSSKRREYLRVNRPGAQMLLAFFSVAATSLFVGGLYALPLPDSTALNLVGPLFVVAIAPRLLGDQVTLRLWLVLLCGFGGVLIILQPGADSFRWAALLPLGAALSGALRDLTTCRLNVSESSISMLLMSSFLLTLISPIIPSGGWTWVPSKDICLLAIAAVALMAANYCLIVALRTANASLVVPLRYSTMIWAIPFSGIVWHEWPSRNVLLGSALLIASGIYFIRVASRRKPHGPAGAEPLAINEIV